MATDNKIMNRLNIGGQIKHVAQEDLENNIDAFAQQYGSEKIYVNNPEGKMGSIPLSNLKSALSQGYTLFDDTQGYLNRDDINTVSQQPSQESTQPQQTGPQPEQFSDYTKGNNIANIAHNLPGEQGQSMAQTIRQAVNQTEEAIAKTPKLPWQTDLEYTEKVAAESSKIQQRQQAEQAEYERQMAIPQTIEEIDMQIAQLDDQLREYDQQSMVIPTRAGDTAPNFGRLFNPNRKELSAEQILEKRELDDQKQALRMQRMFLDKIQKYQEYDKVQDRTAINKLFEGMSINGDMASFATFGLSQLDNDQQFLQILDKVDRGVTLTTDENKALILYQNMQQLASKKRGAWFNAGSGFSKTFEFMRDMALGGMSGGFKAIASQGLKATIKTLSKQFTKKALEAAWKTPLLPGFKTALSENAINNYNLQNYGTDQEPVWNVDKLDSTGKLIYKTWAQNYSEYLTESMGAVFENIGLLSRIARTSGKAGVILDKAIKQYDRIHNAALHNSVGRFLSQGFENVGLQNFPSEFMEEIINVPLQSLMMWDSSQLEQLANPAFYQEVGISTAALGGMVGAANMTIGGATAAIEKNKHSKALKQSLEAVNQIINSTGDDAKKAYLTDLVNDLDSRNFYNEKGEFDGKKILSDLTKVSQYVTDAKDRASVQQLVKEALYKEGQTQALKAIMEDEYGSMEYGTSGDVWIGQDKDRNELFILGETADTYLVNDPKTKQQRFISKSDMIEDSFVIAPLYDIAGNYFINQAMPKNLETIEQVTQAEADIQQQTKRPNPIQRGDKVDYSGELVTVEDVYTDGDGNLAAIVVDNNDQTHNVPISDLVKKDLSGKNRYLLPDGRRSVLYAYDNGMVILDVLDDNNNIVERIQVPLDEFGTYDELSSEDAAAIESVPQQSAELAQTQSDAQPDIEQSQAEILQQQPQVQTETVQPAQTEVQIPLDKDGNTDFDALLETSPELFAQEYSKIVGPEETLTQLSEVASELDKQIKKKSNAAKKQTSFNKKAQMFSDISALKNRREALVSQIMKMTQPQEQIQNTVEGQTDTKGENVISKKWQDSQKVEGNTDVRTLPDGSQLKGRWVLAEADAATPSHNPHTLQPSEGFPTTAQGKNINDNDYTKKSAEVRIMAANYDGRAIDNPIFVKDGIVVSGNNRTMSGILAAENGTDSKYLQSLQQRAQALGFTQQQIELFNHPRVFFEVEDDIPMTTEMFAKFNQRETKSKTPTERAIVASKRDNSRLVSLILSEIDKYEKLSDVYQNQNATAAIVRYMVETGLINNNEVAELYENGFFTANGKDFLESLLIGTVIGEDQIKILNTEGMKPFRGKIVKNIIPLIENTKLRQENQITGDLNQAILYLYQAKASSLSLDEYVRQNDMFERRLFDEDAVFVAIKLQQNEREFRSFVEQVNARLSVETPNMFTGQLENKQDIYGEFEQQLTESERAALNSARETNAQTKALSSDGTGAITTRKELDGVLEESQPKDEIKPVGVGVFGNIYNQFKGKAKEAIAFLTKQRSGEAIGALTHPEVGEISLVWGNSKAGLEKIWNKHSEVLDDLQAIIQNMNVVQRSDNRIKLESPTHFAVISKDWKGTPREQWLLTAYEKKEMSVSGGSMDINPEPSGKQNDTAPLQNTHLSEDKVNEPSSDIQQKSEQTVLETAQNNALNQQIDQQAEQADTNPTQAQKEAGNYKMGHVKVQGLDISIENPAGSIRSGVDQDGKPWSVTMNNHYGYIRGTKGKDKDHIDVFLGENLLSDKVYVVDQVNEDGAFDEHKVMIGFDSVDDAKAAYLSNYSEGWQGLGNITEVPMSEFKMWISNGTRKIKPFTEYKAYSLDAIKQQAQQYSQKYGTPVEVVESADQIKHPLARRAAEQGGLYGWYDVKTSKVFVYAPNILGRPDELEKTVLHEVVAHKGLRSLLGDTAFDKVCDEVWDMMSETDKIRYISYIKNIPTNMVDLNQIGQGLKDKREAADEYMASIAEDGITNPSVWEKIKRIILDALREVGINIPLTDADIAYMLYRSSKALQKNATLMEQATATKSVEAVEQSLSNPQTASQKGFDQPLRRREVDNQYWDTFNRAKDIVGATGNGTSVYQQGQTEDGQKYVIRLSTHPANMSNFRSINPNADFILSLVITDNFDRSRQRQEPIDNDKDTFQVIINPDSLQSDIDWRMFEKGIKDFKQSGDLSMYLDSGVRFRNIKSINDKFNEDLQKQIDGVLPKGYIYSLGMPSEVLLTAGLPNLPIELAASRLSDKSMQENHPFELSEMMGLVNAIQNPIAVFRSATHLGSYVVLTEIQHKGKNYVVAIKTNKNKGRIRINDIRSVHYRKSNSHIANWIIEGLHEYVDKQKMLEWLSKQQYNSAEVRNLFKRATKVVNDFENPTNIRLRYKTSQGKNVNFTQLSLFDQAQQSEQDPLLDKRLRPLQEGEFCHVERIFTQSKAFDFTSGEQIKSSDDVAYIFSQLENESIENAFAVLVKNGKPYVIHVGMGGFDASYFNIGAIVAADKLINADEIYMVHNHPSGALEASNADVQMYNRFVAAFGNRAKEGIIINLTSGRYGVFTDTTSSKRDKTTVESQVPIKLYSFNKQVFDYDFDPKQLFSVTGSSSVASFISSQRLGDRAKINILVLNRQNKVVGNILTEHKTVDMFGWQMDQLANQIVDYTIKMGGSSAIVYGSGVEMDQDMRNNLATISKKVKAFSGYTVEVLDWIYVSGKAMNYMSAMDEGIRFRKENSLIGLHNISEDKLVKAIRQGGLANPSAAVIDLNTQSHEGYGDISLIMPKSLVDKKTGRNVGTFTADAWTPTYPDVQKQISDKGRKAYRQALNDLDTPLKNRIALYFDNYLDSGILYDALFYWYALENGLNPELVTNDSGQYSKEELDKMMSILDGESSFWRLSAEKQQQIINMYKEYDGGVEESDAKSRRILEKLKSNVDNVEGLMKKRVQEKIELYEKYGLDITKVSDWVYKAIDAYKRFGEVNEYRTFDNAIKLVNDKNLRDDLYNRWLPEIEEKFDVKEFLYAGTDNQGRQKWLPNTLQNASRLMNRQQVAGGVGGASFNHFVAVTAPKATSLKQIKARQANLSNDDKYDQFRKKWENIYQDLALQLQPGASVWEDYGQWRMEELVDKRNPKAFAKSEYDIELSDEFLKNFSELISAIKNDFPARYFETKFARPVMLDEFVAAVVPDNTSESVIQALKDAGLNIGVYKVGDNAERKQLIEQFADDNVRFRRVTAEMDAEYMTAVKSGDMRAAQDMVNQAAQEAGYNSDTSYQGSLAFNGAAPSQNAYFTTKDERKQAWENGEYEDTFSLGDYVDNNIDTHDLDWRLTDPRARMNEEYYTIESINNLKNTVRNGERTIKMFRAVPANVKKNSFRNGDWVTPSRSYAQYHIGLQDWNKGRIIEQEVSIDDIWWNGDDINEWGFDDGKTYGYQNTKNNRKSLEAVTYDDNGNVIPLSKRFNNRNADVRFRTRPISDDEWQTYQQRLDEVDAQISRADGLVSQDLIDERGRIFYDVLRRLANEPFSIVSQIDFRETMEYIGADQDAINAVKNIYNNPENISPALFSEGHMFFLVENISSIEDLRLALVHERQHGITHQDWDYYYNEIINRVSGIEELRSVVNNISFGNYATADLSTLVDEFPSFAMMHVYSNANYPQRLQQLGVNDRLIDFIKQLDYGQKQNNNYINSRRWSQTNKISNGIDMGSDRQDVRDQSEGSAEMDQQRTRSISSSQGGTQGAEGEELITPPEDKIRFRYSPIFQSNAERATLAIKQNKATAEQWLAMLQKNGGLKAGEDKWIGLSDWLKQQQGSVTKDQVLDYIRQNQIQVEEVWYSDEVNQADLDLDNEVLSLWRQASGNNYDKADWVEKKLAEKYGSEFSDAATIWYDGSIRVKNQSLLSKLIGSETRPINSTRLDYTTEGLKNNKEIALVVPSTEPWGKSDETHFGDAGDGRAIAWVRFGQTSKLRTVTYSKSADNLGKSYKNFNGNDVYPIQGEKSDYIAHKALKDGTMRYVPYVKDKLIGDTVETATFATLQQAQDALNAYYANHQSKRFESDKILVIDEIQSKRHQEGRERGYRVADINKWLKDNNVEVVESGEFYEFVKNGETDRRFSKGLLNYDIEKAKRLYVSGYQKSDIPDAPFGKNWHELALKRMLRYAAENNYDVLAWTKGEQQAERYNIGSTVDKIESDDNVVEQFEDGTPVAKDITIWLKEGSYNRFSVDANGNIRGGVYGGHKLSDVVGKELAIKLMKPGHVSLDGNGLTVGGEGMKGFYDKMLVDYMNKYGKKWGVEVEDIDLPSIDQTMHSIKVTDAMKESVLSEPQLLFRKVVDQMIMPQQIISDGLIKTLGQQRFDNMISDIYSDIPLLEKAVDVKRGVSKQQAVAALVDKVCNNIDDNQVLFQQIVMAVKDALNDTGVVMMPDSDDLLVELWKATNLPQALTIKERLANGAAIRDIRLRVEKKAPPQTNQVKLSRMELWRERLLDRMISVNIFYNELKKLGIKISDDTDPYVTENLAMSRSQTEDAQFKKEIYQPLIEQVIEVENLFIELGLAKDREDAYKKVNNLLYARHAPERNKNICVEEVMEKALRKISAEQMALFKDSDVRGVMTALISRMYNEKSSPSTPVTSDTFAKNMLLAKGADKKQQDQLNSFRGKFAGIVKDAKEDISNIFASERGTNRSGMTDQEAKDIMAMYYTKDTKQAVDKLSDWVRQSTHFTVDTWYKYSLIDDKTRDNIKKMYRYYIPLRSWEEKEDVDYDNLTNQAFNKASEIINLNRKASGRTSRADDPLVYIASLAQSAIVIGNKNMIRLNLYRLIKSNQDVKGLDQYATLPKLYYVETPGSDVVIAYDERPAQELFDQNLVKTKTNKSYKWHKSGAEYDAHIVPVILNGTRQMIELRGELGVKVASAINNTNVLHWQAADALKPITNWLSAVRTSYNPEFILTNFARDFMFSNLVYPTEGGSAKELNKNLKQAFKSIYRLTKGKPVNSKWDAYYKEFLQEGGQTGFFAMRNIDQMRKEIEKMHKQLQSGKMSRHAIAKILKNLAEHSNNLSESAMRLAVFITEREKGTSAKQAAYKAHEISVNFNRKGTWSGNFGGFYSFFNASMQGTSRLFTWVGQNKQKSLKALAAITFVKLATNIIAALVGGDDYDELSDYVKFSNIVIPIGTDSNDRTVFFCIPMAQGIRAVTNLADNVVDCLTGNKSVAEATKTQIVNTVGEFLPLSFDAIDLTGRNTSYSIASAFTPTVVQPWMDIWVNMDFKGDPIYKEPFLGSQKGFTPEYKNVYGNTNPVLVGVSRYLNNMAGGSNERTSAIWKNKKGEVSKSPFGYMFDINPARAEHLLNAYLGGLMSFPSNVIKTAWAAFDSDTDVQLYNFPVANRFAKKPYQKDGYQTYYQIRDYVEMTKNTISAARKEGDFEGAAVIQSRNIRLLEMFEAYDDRVKQLRQLLKSNDLSVQSRLKVEKDLDEIVNQAANQLQKILDDEKNTGN